MRTNITICILYCSSQDLNINSLNEILKKKLYYTVIIHQNIFVDIMCSPNSQAPAPGHTSDILLLLYLFYKFYITYNNTVDSE